MIPRPLTGCGDITVCLVRDTSNNSFTNEDLSRLKGFAVAIGDQEGPVVGTVLDAWIDNGSLFGRIRLRLTRACWKAVVSPARSTLLAPSPRSGTGRSAQSEADI